MRDLTREEGPGDLQLRLRCTQCGELQRFGRKPDDSKRVVRCLECGKKHSTESLEVRD